MRLGLTFTTVMLYVFAGTQAHAANIVVNGGFEANGGPGSSTFSGWAVHGSYGPWGVGFFDNSSSTTHPYAGTYYASNGCVLSPCINGTTAEQSSLSQTLTTVVGDIYTLDFEFSTGGFSTPNELRVIFGGVVVEDFVDAAITGYQEVTITGLVATSTSTTLEFLGRNAPGHSNLDEVSVVDTGASPAPEPAAWLLVAIGSAALAGSRLRKTSVN